MSITENDIERLAIDGLQELGYTYLYGPALSEGSSPERGSTEDVLLENRLRAALARLNPSIPHDTREHVQRDLVRIHSPELISNNEQFHTFLTEGIPVSYRTSDGEEKHDYVWLIDFENTEKNDFLVVNQYTLTENGKSKRLDVLLFVNGLPLVVLELKNAAGELATIGKAYNQIQTYKAVLPSLFTYNTFCVISDGHECKAGTISSDLSRYMAWKTADGHKEASRFTPQLETLIRGMLAPSTLLDLVRHFVVFEKNSKEDPATGLVQVEITKKLAAYHQYYAVNKAVQSTMQAASANGNRKGGVVWHTQGSGKSLSMVFYAGKLVLGMDNPTIVVLTDRNDLDNQLFDNFAAAQQLLRQAPVQATSRDHLKQLLKVASGGIVFTTIQKFLPEFGKSEFDRLSDRTNIIVIADEAHRTQYGFEARLVDEKDKASREVVGARIAYGFAKYMRDALPRATYIGFTGTPIESTDVNTPEVFGQYVDIYDIAQAVEDGAIVSIYYESRLAKVNIDDEGRRLIEEFDSDIAEDEEDEQVRERQRIQSKWARLEAIVGHPERLKNLARDIVTHFEQRQSIFEGKGMIVTMSRRIAADLYNQIIVLRPEWHSEDVTKGAIKVIMTASSDDGEIMQRFHTTKAQQRTLAERMKDPNDPLKMVIVRDMWLTGFDAPSLHTLYVDKPMRGHNLMQAIARVNRVFKDKPGGLVVDYIGIATALKQAVSFYSAAGGRGKPTELQGQAIGVFFEKLEIVRQMFQESSRACEDIRVEEPRAYYFTDNLTARFNYERFFDASAREKLSIILQAAEHLGGIQDGMKRFIRNVTVLGRALALCITNEEVGKCKEEVAFYQAVKARLVKFEERGGESSGLELETAIKQIVDEALSSEHVVDIFDAAGIQKPDISILSEEFLQEVQGMKHKNLALELLKKLLRDEIKTRARSNIVKSKALLDMLEAAINSYQNNLLTTIEVIQRLMEIAREIRESANRGEKLGLSDDELAFYDALGANDSAIQVLGDDTLRNIAKEIAEKVKTNTSIDWAVRESTRANMRALVKRTLRKYGYPPDAQLKAVDTVLKQMEYFAGIYAEGEVR